MRLKNITQKQNFPSRGWIGVNCSQKKDRNPIAVSTLLHAMLCLTNKEHEQDSLIPSGSSVCFTPVIPEDASCADGWVGW